MNAIIHYRSRDDIGAWVWTIPIVGGVLSPTTRQRALRMGAQWAQEYRRVRVTLYPAHECIEWRDGYGPTDVECAEWRDGKRVTR